MSITMRKAKCDALVGKKIAIMNRDYEQSTDKPFQFMVVGRLKRNLPYAYHIAGPGHSIGFNVESVIEVVEQTGCLPRIVIEGK